MRRTATIVVSVVCMLGMIIPAASASPVHRMPKVPCPDFVWYCYVLHHHRPPPLWP
jgi:hypothetical protein